MTTPQQQPPPPPAAPQQQPPAAGQGEETRVHTIAELAERQAKTESKLDQILARLPGGSPAPAAPQQQQQPAAGPDPGTVAEQMRQAVRDVAAEQHNASQQQAAPPAETKPREVALRGKARLQKAFFGALDGQR